MIMKQKIFRKGLIENFLLKIREEDEKFMLLYLNKERFDFPFDPKVDFVDSDLPSVPHDLGYRLEEIFLRFTSPESTDYRNADFECAKYLYENLPLTPRQASNTEFWNYLHHTKCYKYIHLRWSKIETSNIQTYILRHWLMNKSSQKHLINFPLTTLWWSIHISIDSSRTDRYGLSEIFFRNNRYRTVMPGGSSFVRHKEALLGVLEFIKEEELQPTAELGDEISRFVNLLGGTKPLSFFDRSWFKDQLKFYFNNKDMPQKKDVHSRNQASTDNSIETHSLFNISDFDSSSKQEIKHKSKSETSKVSTRVLKYFNLKENGTYSLTSLREKGYNHQIPIYENYRKGYLLLCYYEDGNINRVTVDSLLRRKRLEYKNGLYKEHTLRKLLLIPEKAIIGICYDYMGIRYFKAHLADKFKDKNSNMRLKGYKTLYADYNLNSVNFFVLPIDIKDSIEKLIFDSFTAAGKPVNNSYYKDEFELIKKYAGDCFKDDLNLF